MNHTLSLFNTYWSASLIEVNLLVFANLVGALLLGLLVGYERSYHGRAAGMRTYGIVCMASAKRARSVRLCSRERVTKV